MSARIRLFLSSYVPLFVIAAVRMDSAHLRLGMAVLSITGVVSLATLIRVSRRLERRAATPTAVRDLGSEVAAYVATYLLPFVMVGEPDTADIFAYSLALLTIGAVFVQSDLIGINPLLYVLGYRIYSVEGVRTTAKGVSRNAVLISRSEVTVGASLDLADLANGVSLVLRQQKEPPNAGY